jgi:hypothetical protein
MAGGMYHSLVLLSTGAVYGSGLNTSGELGHATGAVYSTPVSITGLPSVCSLAAGWTHSVVRGCDGSVWTFGENLSGQIGDGTFTPRKTPWQVVDLPAIVTIGAGASHTLARGTDGSLYAWGRNSEGQLGDGTLQVRVSPTQIAAGGGAWNTATPTFSVMGGTYGVPQTVIIATVTAGAEIHYTLNGQDPELTDPSIASGASVTIDQTRTLKARAWKADMPPSHIAAATYTMQVNVPSFNPWGATFASPPVVSMSTTTPGAQLRYTLDGATPTEASPLYTGPITMSTTTTMKAIGYRSGWSASTVTSSVYTLNYGTLATPVMSPTPGTYTSEAAVTLTATTGATIRYTTNGTTPTATSTIYAGPIAFSATTTLKAKAFRTDYADSAAASGTYTVVVADPVFDLPAGLYLSGQEVHVTTATSGATIRYTLTGVNPVGTDATIASGGTLIVGNYTLTAHASKTGTTTSAVTSVTYTVSGE